MYSETATLNGENVMSVLYCAKKYMIPGLQTLCRQYLDTQLDSTNVCIVLEQVQRKLLTMFFLGTYFLVHWSLLPNFVHDVFKVF